jgi:MoxR-like ATPase
MSNAPSYSYSKAEFNPGHVHTPSRGSKHDTADHRTSPVYVYNEDLILAINVALATRRPLLVRGASGAGKSTLARSAADVLKWRFYEHVVTSRTEARDMLWQVDLLRRLHDAQAAAAAGATLGEDHTPYVKPGPLWWAFDRKSASWRGASANARGTTNVPDPWTGTPAARAVVLIDEIDKADPDVPNNLLVPLGSLQFQVEETGFVVQTDQDRAPLVFITTNEERELPRAFLRRCVEVRIQLPTRARLLEIGQAHFPGTDSSKLEKILEALLGPVVSPEQEAKPTDLSPAEFIDAVRATNTLGIGLGDIDRESDTWKALSGTVIWKHGRTPEKSA